ncbi:MAG: hypothetical protein MZU95_05950 [Desulfomicrobium escambiense]|nr:hypothetical protein [Desulfomicrobium escambiense]
MQHRNSWAERLFAGWGLAVMMTPFTVILSVLLALISTLWSRMIRTNVPPINSRNIGGMLDLIGWAFSVVAATGAVFMFRPDAPLVLMVLLPQLLSYPLTRTRIWMRPLWPQGWR